MGSVNTTEERVELTLVDRQAAPLASAQRNWQGFTTSVDTAKNALVAIGAVAGAGAMVSLAQDIIKANAALDDMAESTGASVENLSRLQVVARIGNHDFSGMTDVIGKMIKGLKGADEEGQAAGHALAFLNIQAKDANGRFRDSVEILQELADKLGQYEDGGNKVALVQDVLGKGAARYLPLLKDMAEEGRQQARVTGEQAAEAEKLEKNWNRLKMVGEDWRRELVIGITPAIVDFTEKLLAAQRVGAGGLLGLGAVLFTGTDNIPAKLKELKAELADLEQPESKIWSFFRTFTVQGKLAGAVKDFGREQAISGVNTQIAYLEQLQKQREQAGARAGARDPNSPLFEFGGQPLGYNSPGKPAAAAAAKAPTRTADDVMNELAGVSRNFQSDLALLHAEYERGGMTLETYTTTVGKLISKQQFSQEIARQEKQLRDDINKAIDQTREKQERDIASTDEEIRKMRERIGEIGLTTEELGRLRVARMDDAIAVKEREIALERAQGAEEWYVRNLEKQVAQLRELRNLTGDETRKTAQAEAQKQAREEQDRTNEYIKRTLTDSIMRSFERGGQKGSERLKEILANASKTFILEPTIRMLVSPFARAGSAIAGSMFGGNAMAGGGMMAGGGIGGWMGAGGGIGSSLMGLSLGADSVFQNAGTFFGSQGLADIGNFGFGAPVLGGLATWAMTGNAGAGLMSTGLGIAGNMLLPGIGGVIGSAVGGLLGGSLFGGGGMSAPRSVRYDTGLGQAGNAPWGGDAWAAHTAAQEQLLIQRLGLNPAQIGAVNQAISSNAQTFKWGDTRDWFESTEYSGPLAAQRMQVIAQALGSSIEQLTTTMAMSADQWSQIKEQERFAMEALRQQAIAQLNSQRDALTKSGGAFVGGLSGTLGITALEDFQNQLSIADFNSPTARLSSAQEQYRSVLGRARGGDLTAVNALPGVASQYLDVGRSAYASGQGFQDIAADIRSSIADVLGRQRDTLADITREIPSSIMEAGHNTIEAIKRQTASLVEELRSLGSKIDQLSA